MVNPTKPQPQHVDRSNCRGGFRVTKALSDEDMAMMLHIFVAASAFAQTVANDPWTNAMTCREAQFIRVKGRKGLS